MVQMRYVLILTYLIRIYMFVIFLYNIYDHTGNEKSYLQLFAPLKLNGRKTIHLNFIQGQYMVIR